MPIPWMAKVLKAKWSYASVEFGKVALSRERALRAVGFLSKYGFSMADIRSCSA